MNLRGIVHAAAWSWVFAAAAVEPGDSPAQVRAELGIPSGELRVGTRLLYSYARGEVEFRDGRATRIELVTPEEAVARTAAREAEAAERSRRAAAEREARITAGRAELARARLDAALPLKSPSAQVAYWASFRQRFPEVAVDAEYAQALRLLEMERTEARLAEIADRRIEDLEKRLSAAEDRARDAERRSLRRSYSCYGDGLFPYPAYYYPVHAQPGWHETRVERRDDPAESPRRLTVTFQQGASLVRSPVSLVRGSCELVRD